MFTKSTTSLALIGAAVLVLGSACPVLAQGGQGGGRQGGFGRMGGGRQGGFARMGGLMLLRNKSVQTELKMTQPQIDKLDTKQQELMQTMRDAFPNAGQNGGQNQDRAARQAAMTKIREAQDKAVADILDSTQLARFKQIELQVAGPGSVTTNTALATSLGITDEQKTQITKIQTDAFAAQRDLMPQGTDFRTMSDADRTTYQQKLAAAQKDTNAKIVAVFSPAQKAKWEKMLGAAFKYVPEQGGFGGFGGQRGNRRGGGNGQ